MINESSPVFPHHVQNPAINAFENRLQEINDRISEVYKNKNPHSDFSEFSEFARDLSELKNSVETYKTTLETSASADKIACNNLISEIDFFAKNCLAVNTITKNQVGRTNENATQEPGLRGWFVRRILNFLKLFHRRRAPELQLKDNIQVSNARKAVAFQSTTQPQQSNERLPSINEVVAAPSEIRVPEVEIQVSPATNQAVLNVHQTSIVENTNVTQIHVLDQRDAVNGSAACGFHSWKNAFISLALTTTANPHQEIVDLYNDKNFFNDEVFPYLNQFNTDGTDIALTSLHDATEKFMTEEIDPQRYPKLHRLQSELRGIDKDNISFLQSLEDFESTHEDFLLGVSSGSQYMSNLTKSIKAFQKPGPCTHAFVSGKNGHWVTLIMQKDAEGKTTWYATDSWGNQTREITTQKDLIAKLQNTGFQKRITRMEFESGFTDSMRLAAQKLNSEGVPTENIVSNSASVKKNIEIITNLTHFLKEITEQNLELFRAIGEDSNLIDSYLEDMSELNKLALFYKKYIADLPDVDDEVAMEAFFETYPPYAEFNPDHFGNHEVSSPLLSDRPDLERLNAVSSMKVDDLKTLEALRGRPFPLSSEDRALYRKELEKFFDVHGSEAVIQALVDVGIFSQTDRPSNYQSAINKLIEGSSAAQLKDVRNMVYKINQAKLYVCLFDNDLLEDPQFADMPIDLNAALVLVKRAILEKHRPALQEIIDADKETVKRELFAQKENLQRQLSSLPQ